MERLASELAENLEAFRTLFHAPENCDFVVRELAPHGVRMAALYIDGMANRRNLEDMVLRPLMIVAGDHANNDMAGDEEGSWKSAFEKAGYEVTVQINGLGELEAIQQLLVAHARAAMDSLR